jgi:CRISPR-associated protein Cas2
MTSGCERLFKKMCGFGISLQYSIFRCELSPTEKQLLKDALWDILNLNEDRVMLVNLGPTGARGDDCTEFWGEPRTEVGNRAAVIV